MMTKKKPVHHGEALMLMSGEHGTLLVEDGDTYPDWYHPEVTSADESKEESD